MYGAGIVVMISLATPIDNGMLVIAPTDPIERISSRNMCNTCPLEAPIERRTPISYFLSLIAANIEFKRSITATISDIPPSRENTLR